MKDSPEAGGNIHKGFFFAMRTKSFQSLHIRADRD